MPRNANDREFVRISDYSEITYQSEIAKTKKKTETKNISAQGICFVSKEKFAIDSVVEVSLTFERLGFSFTSKSVVRWVNEIVRNHRYEVGVKFIDVSLQETKKLVNYIDTIKRLDRYV